MSGPPMTYVSPDFHRSAPLVPSTAVSVPFPPGCPVNPARSRTSSPFASTRHGGEYHSTNTIDGEPPVTAYTRVPTVTTAAAASRSQTTERDCRLGSEAGVPRALPAACPSRLAALQYGQVAWDWPGATCNGAEQAEQRTTVGRPMIRRVYPEVSSTFALRRVSPPEACGGVCCLWCTKAAERCIHARDA